MLPSIHIVPQKKIINIPVQIEIASFRPSQFIIVGTNRVNYNAEEPNEC
jgi:hypothetical protein